jgi:predicted MFS family arabinose efflux permease
VLDSNQRKYFSRLHKVGQPAFPFLGMAAKSSAKFSKLWASSGISNLADGIGLTAAPLLAATLTRDPLLVSGLTIAQRLPWFLFTLISGALVDRLDRRQVLGLANLARFLLLVTLGLIVLTKQSNLPTLYLICFTLGTIETFFDNASLAILPSIVSDEQFEAANGRLFATSSLANELVGPPLGSYLFSLIQPVSFFAASVSYGLSALLIQRIKGQFAPGEAHHTHLISEIKEGWRWFWRHRLLRTLGFFAATFNFVSSATMSVFVLYAQDVLGISEAAYGLIISFGAIGGILGSLLTKRLSDRFGAGRILFADAFLSGAAFVAIGISARPVTVGAMFALISMSSMFGNVIIISLRQAIIPDRLLGRVASAYRLVVLGALPIGALFGGLVARSTTLAAPFLAGGALLVITAFAMQPVVNNGTIQSAREFAQESQGGT